MADACQQVEDLIEREDIEIEVTLDSGSYYDSNGK